jgi:hypothetical protein
MVVQALHPLLCCRFSLHVALIIALVYSAPDTLQNTIENA